MKKKDMMQFSGKTNIRIVLKSGIHYTAKLILSITDESIKFRDKFDSIQLIELDSISQIGEI